MKQNSGSRISEGLPKPLCRRYSAVVFSAAPLEPANREGNLRSMSWGLGVLANREVEILGTWANDGGISAVPAGAIADLHSRGVEFINVVIGDFEGAEEPFTRTYRRGQLLQSIEQALESAAMLVPVRHRFDVSEGLRAVAETNDAEARWSALERFQASSLGERYPDVAEQWGRALAGFEPIYALSAQLRGLARSADRVAADVRGRLTRAILRHGPFVDSAAALDFVATALDRAEQRMDRERAAKVAARQAGSKAMRRKRLMADAVGVPTLA